MALSIIFSRNADPSSEAAEVARSVQPSVVLVRTDGAGAGSGIAWHADGRIITNSHVVPGHSAIVEARDGDAARAEVIRRDLVHDLALLAVVAPVAPPATARAIPALRAGELVFAVGNPLGMRNVVTAGIVAASGGQPWPGREGIKDAIQAQIRLLPGNSGGPLVDAAGRVVGVNAMVVHGGLALAIPTRTVERFVDGSARAQLGVATRPVELRSNGAATTDRALLIIEIVAGSAAESAGLLVGDVLLDAAGVRLTTPTSLIGLLDERSPGEALELSVNRGGRRIRLTAQLGQRPD